MFAGNVVNISSVSGMRPVWGALPYAMCKAAVDQFTRCTSQGQFHCHIIASYAFNI